MAVANSETQFTLRSLDTGLEWRSQYQPIDVRHNRQSNWTNVNSVNRNHPFTSWISGRVETLQFKLRLFAHAVGMIYEDMGLGISPDTFPVGKIKLTDKIADLEKLYYKDNNLGRPHILQFTWGRINMRVAIIKLTTAYGELDSIGVHRDVIIELVLKRFEEIPAVNEASRVAKVNESRFYNAKNYESYEAVAGKGQFYGNPKFGEFLRRRHPETNDLIANARIHIPPTVSTLDFRLTPQSLVFDRSSTNAMAALVENQDRANRTFISTIVTTEL